MGPWARSLIAAVLGRAERPADEALRRVREFRVETGTVSGTVAGCIVTLRAERVPPRVWGAMTRFVRGRGPLEEAVAGRLQSLHLEQLLAEDWGEPLIPRSSSIDRSCSCDDDGACEHVVALTFVLAERVDADPAVLLRWRGCVDDASAVEGPSGASAVVQSVDPWRGGVLAEPSEPRVLPAGAVLKRLGPSEIRVGDVDLGELLVAAYDALVAPPG
jgi:hypothetical protein